MLEIIVAVIAFAIGTLLGSFSTLAVYRLPIKQDITHERSYCPKCNHKLTFLDLIPVLSYIFLGGKCRYCKDKIRPRYLILEISSGLMFMLFILSLKLDLLSLQIADIFKIFFGMIYVTIFAITAGIDLENKRIEKGMMNFTFITSIIYMLYLYILGVNMYRYVIYLMIIICLLVIGKIKPNYTLDIITYMLITLLYIGTEAMILIIATVFIVIAIQNILNKIRKTKFEPAVAAVFSIVSICILIVRNFVTI